jgi:hypothetical protein
MKARLSVAAAMLGVMALTVFSPFAQAQTKQTTPPEKKPAATATAPAMNVVPSIEGTYKFVSRKLPDGKTISPPDAQGLQTFTKGYRNFNIMWKDSTGKHFSYSVASTYKLTDKEYTETLLYSAMNDELGVMPGSKPGIQYATGESKSSPVKVEGLKVEFHLPFDPPNVVFEGGKLTATLEGGFVDTWEKVR